MEKISVCVYQARHNFLLKTIQNLKTSRDVLIAQRMYHIWHLAYEDVKYDEYKAFIKLYEAEKKAGIRDSSGVKIKR